MYSSAAVSSLTYFVSLCSSVRPMNSFVYLHVLFFIPCTIANVRHKYMMVEPNIKDLRGICM